MAVLRFLGNLLLALVLILLIALVLFSAYGIIASRVWETFGLDYAVNDGEWLWIDGQPIYYRVSGNEKGGWLVMVHGFQVEGSETWASNAQILSKWGLHVVEVDLRGFGHSVRDSRVPVVEAPRDFPWPQGLKHQAICFVPHQGIQDSRLTGRRVSCQQVVPHRLLHTHPALFPTW